MEDSVTTHLGCFESTFGERKKTPTVAHVFYAFQQSCNIPCAWITLSCMENHLVLQHTVIVSLPGYYPGSPNRLIGLKRIRKNPNLQDEEVINKSHIPENLYQEICESTHG